MVALRDMRVPIAVLLFVAKICFCQEADQEYPEDAFQALQDTAKAAEFFSGPVAERVMGKLQMETSRSLALKLQPVLRGVNNGSEHCAKDMKKLLDDIASFKLYALQFADSSSKVPSGILRGKTKWLGSFDECMNTVAKENGKELFRGRYCHASVSLKAPGSNSTLISVNIGTCVPSSCNAHDAEQLINKGMAVFSPGGDLDLVARRVTCVVEYDLDSGDIATLTVIGVLIFLVLAATALDVFRRMKKKQSEEEGNDKLTFLGMHPIQSISANDVAVNGNGLTQENGLQSKCVEHLENGSPPKVDLSQDTTLPIGNGGHTGAPIQHHDLHQSRISQIELVGKDTVLETTSIAAKSPGVSEVLCNALLAFSAYTNCSKIFSLEAGKGSLQCLSGLRVISMIWVVLCHTHQFSPWTVENGADIYEFYVKRFTAMAIVNATFCVDTFFFLSGLLVAYLTLRELRRGNGKINWFLYYFHRFWRLTPVYMFVILLSVHVWPHFRQGASSSGYPKRSTGCAENWWRNMIYINNFQSGCMGTAWYMANDMQFFVISPIILILLYRYKKVGISLILLLITACLATTAGISNHYGLTPNRFIRTTKPPLPRGDLIYRKPYTRIAPYLVGMLVGYVFFLQAGKKIKIKKVFVCIGWAAAVACNMAVLYGVYPLYKYSYVWSNDVNAFYLATSRFAWSLGLAWLTFACQNGYGGPVNAILSWKIWTPLAKLSYTAYLIHPSIIFFYNGQRKVHLHYDDITMASFFMVNAVTTFALALILTLLVEAPSMGLEKVMFKRKRD